MSQHHKLNYTDPAGRADLTGYSPPFNRVQSAIQQGTVSIETRHVAEFAKNSDNIPFGPMSPHIGSRTVFSKSLAGFAQKQRFLLLTEKISLIEK
ncbi:MAG: hypothetical protein P1V20_18915 [Verrucomicrobiales bacterium]|nr:hypothetical protein [Verrucomicrobiales bacterium]